MIILHGHRSRLLHGPRSWLFYTGLDHDFLSLIFCLHSAPILIQGEKAISLSYGHTQLNPPHPVRSAKLNSRWQSQYYGGGPHGNTLCCSFFIFFCQSFIFCPHTPLICTHSHTWWSPFCFLLPSHTWWSPFCLSFVPFALTHTWYAPIHTHSGILFFLLVVCSLCLHPHLICTHSYTGWSPFCLSFVLFTLTHTWYAPIHTHGGRIVY
jgi:hypothetical protein